MRILHTVEFYNPSTGGAQEVVRQVSEQLVKRGHSVTVATSFDPKRSNLELNGVQIQQFDIRGNAVQGYHGDMKGYLDFLHRGDFELMMNYAAQQWATDLVFSELENLPYKKVFIPCGFSALYDPAYTAYFARLPDVLRSYDHLVFHAENYRDINFARQHGLTSWSVIPNGASKVEFENPDPTFRQRFNIPADMPLLLTIGTHTGTKGHRLALEAFQRLKIPKAVLIIIGNTTEEPANLWSRALRPILGAVKRGNVRRAGEIIHQTFNGGSGSGCLADCRMRAAEINRNQAPNKQVLLLDLPRKEVISALHAADLFIFGSNIEYSPLVLFEAMASRTPFLTLACGNAAEIVEWSNGGGLLAPTIQKNQGYVDGNPSSFANLADELLADPDRLQAMGASGYAAWKAKYMWEKIAVLYEALYQSLL